MLTNDVDSSLAKFKEIAKHFSSPLTESDTRAKIIDPVFKECLGWVEEEICREQFSSPDFIDYVFSIDRLKRFVIEAKKEGQSFFIPQSFSGRMYKINGSIWSDKPIRDAIEQAQKYCIISGVNFGIVTNGHQYIIFEAFKRGVDWRQGNCLIFHSFEDIANNFGLFWEILNKNCVKNGSLRRYISKDSAEAQYFFRPIDRLHSKFAALTRNNLSPILTPLAEWVFWDIIDEEHLDILKQCYVLRRHDQEAFSEIGRHFDGVPEFAKKFMAKDILESENNSGVFQNVYERINRLYRESSPKKGTLIILMGGVGSGKTTFIYHFFAINKPKNALWFYINFFDVPEDPNKIEEHVLRMIIDQFNTKYKRDFLDELKQLKMTQLGISLEDVRAIVSLFSLKGYTTSIVLDNVDQHSYINSKYQEQALLVAKRLTNQLNVITLLTLREESYFKSVIAGALDSFPAETFHIASPRFEDLIRRRINYVIDLLRNDEKKLLSIVKNQAIIDADREIAITLFEIISDSLRSSRRVGWEILRFIREILGADMRTALYFFRTFLVSGNTDVSEMLSINEQYRQHNKSGGYQIPFHHIIKSIILEHSRLYNQNLSKIMNIFDFSPDCGNSHFLNLRILNYLFNRLSYKQTQGRGYISIDTIIDEADRVGIDRSGVEDSIRTMARFGLVQFENQSKTGFCDAEFVRITNMGIYYITDLVAKFAYLDLVWMDTPIANHEAVNGLFKYLVETRRYKSADDLDYRFKRTDLFLNYLEDCEKTELENHSEFRDSDLTRTTFVPRIREHFEEEKEYIYHKRRYSPYKSNSAVEEIR